MDRTNFLISYVFHKKNSFFDLDRFLKSLVKFPPQSDCLIVISLKGLSTRSSQMARDMVLKLNFDVKVEILTMEDVGYDIGTHYMVCKKFCPSIILLMSATSEFKSKNWQDLLLYKFNDPNVGAVGSMYSQESLKTGYYELLETRLRILLGLEMDQIHKNIAIVRNYKITQNIYRYKRFKNFYLSCIFYLLFIYHKIVNPIGYRKYFPVFPNPHLRTTGLAVRGSIFMNLVGVLPKNKNESLIFESGLENLSIQIERQNFKLYTVLPNGNYLIFRDKNATVTYRALYSTAIVVDHAWRSFHNFSKMKQQSIVEILNQPRKPSILQVLDNKKNFILNFLNFLWPK